MTAAYPVLRYPGNVTGSEQAQPGVMLGWDEMGRPYEVLDAEYVPRELITEDTYDGDRCDVVGDRGGYTNVFLQYATVETIRAAMDSGGWLPVGAQQ